MLAAVIGGGAIGASAIPAVAADSTTSSSSAQATDGYRTGGQRGPHQANGKTEEILTGDTATTVEAVVKVLIVHPVIAGSGRWLFHDGDPLTRLELQLSQQTSKGNMILSYGLRVD